MSRPAALIYQHGSDARQRQIADSLSKIARQELTGRRSRKGPAKASSGTQRARKRKRSS